MSPSKSESMTKTGINYISNDLKHQQIQCRMSLSEALNNHRTIIERV